MSKSLVGDALRRYLRIYHRHTVTFEEKPPDEQVLIVANHGFGGLIDLNVLAMSAVIAKAGLTRPTTVLVHQIAWTLGLGDLIEALGGKLAGRKAADDALAAGHNVLVFPGGDIDAAKSWSDRNRIKFDGRDGFARLALDHAIPVLPVVTAGAGDSVLVLSDGRRIAEALKLPDRIRVRTLPVSLSIPWGLSVGLVGLLPYLPLPSKLRTAVLPVIRPIPAEEPTALAARVIEAMQHRLDEFVAG
ncbi:MAG: 1-acyl-sn-glycerol-3-phosphate acyltransferase [Mycobacterium sp.]|nr:1-acyl-sn-glycerol-3-phosphate acyltransferase [Mycobacterium sp.]